MNEYPDRGANSVTVALPRDTAGFGYVPTADPEVLNLMQRLGRIEMSIFQATAILNKIDGPPPAPNGSPTVGVEFVPPAPVSAVASAERCLNLLGGLNVRLENMSRAIGRL